MDARLTFKSKRIVHPTHLFSIAIPTHWEWQHELEGENTSFTGIDVVSPKYPGEFINMVSVKLIPSMSQERTLRSEFKSLINQAKQVNTGFVFTESGKINFLKKTAYSAHIQAKNKTKNSSEIISFLMKSEEEDKFYHLTASVSNSGDKLEQMGLLLSILSSIQFPKNSKVLAR